MAHLAGRCWLYMKGRVRRNHQPIKTPQHVFWHVDAYVCVCLMPRLPSPESPLSPSFLLAHAPLSGRLTKLASSPVTAYMLYCVVSCGSGAPNTHTRTYEGLLPFTSFTTNAKQADIPIHPSATYPGRTILYAVQFVPCKTFFSRRSAGRTRASAAGSGR